MGNQQRSLQSRLSWLGGIIDGEGTISLAAKYSRTSRQKNYHFRPELKVSNTDGSIVSEIRDILDEIGCAYYVRDDSTGNRNHKKATKVIVEGIKRLRKFLPVLIPYLIGKRPQAETVLEYIESRLSGPHKAPLSDEQAELVLRVRQLNHRGVANRPETIRRKPATAGL